MTNKLFVDLHVLQTVPPSNLNRDDAGTPKQAIYGGCRRARVSSQAWKRATRLAFADRQPVEHLGTRTKRLHALLTRSLVDRTGLAEDRADRIVQAALAHSKITGGKKAKETAYLLFFGRTQAAELVSLLTDRLPGLLELDEDRLDDALKDFPVEKVLSRGHPMDVALFGRMVADLPNLNVDAAVQVAHSLSTHPVEVEFDYYTAVDDENTEHTGAGMIGTVEFNSATLYRYATVGVHQLAENLGGDTPEAVDATLQALEMFLRCFTTSVPSGHQNAFAHRTTPNLVAVTVREDQPVNLVTAFEEPVRARRGGVACESVVRLARELTATREMWHLDPVHLAATYTPLGGSEQAVRAAFGDPLPFGTVLADTLDVVRGRLAGAVR